MLTIRLKLIDIGVSEYYKSRNDLIQDVFTWAKLSYILIFFFIFNVNLENSFFLYK